MFDIVTIGSVTRDNFLESDFKLIDWPKTPLGKAIVLPFGEKLGIKKVFSTIGGNSANASVTFSRQGFRTACFGKIGNDLAGEEVKKQSKKEKVSPIFSISKNAPTAYSVLLLENGERTILGYHGASDTLTAKDIPWSKLKSKWWYLSLAGDSYKVFESLMNFAKKNNINVAFNPSGHHLKYGREGILRHLKDLAFLVLNEGEAAELVGIPFYKEKEVFEKLDKLVPGIVAVTNGPKGVAVSDGRQIYKAGIFPEKKLADRTGAGDAFGSGFVAGLMLRASGVRRQVSGGGGFDESCIKYAIRLATANATSVVEQVGATEGILTKRSFQSTRWRRLDIKS